MPLIVVYGPFDKNLAFSVDSAHCLDAALDAWADPENDGCVIVVEMPDGTTWHFNQEQHPRFVHGPVQA